MNERELRQLLGTNREDSGCDEAFGVLDRYVEAEVEGRDAESLFPAVAEHFRNCEGCKEDHDGLVALIEGPET